MEDVIAILEDLKPGVDYASCTTLIDDHILDSLTIIALVAELEDAFDVTVPAVEIVPANFNSAAALAALMQRLVEEDF